MKKVEAIIKPFKLDEVRDALGEAGIQGMTMVEVTEFEGQRGHPELVHGTGYTLDGLPKIKVEVVVPDAVAEATVLAVIRGARTGKIGDGKVFVTAVEEAIRIRTNEKGNLAI
jgi:nitrogen regulatory protein PII